MSLELLLHAAEFLELQETKDLKGDEQKVNSPENKNTIIRENTETLSVPFKTTPAFDHRTLISSVDKRILSVKDPEDLNTYHLSSHPYSPTPTAAIGNIRNLKGLGFTQQYLSSPQDSYSASPSLSPSNSSSGGESVSPLGLVSAFRSNVATESSLIHATKPLTSSLTQVRPSENSFTPVSPLEATLSPLSIDGSTQYQINGFIRPNGLTKGVVTPNSTLLEQEDDDNQDSKDDLCKKRAGSTPSREVHNKLEKNRRAHLKECFETLRRQLPSMEDKKISNQTILKAAHKYIETLKVKEAQFDAELEALAREKIAYQQRLSSLKKELQTNWAHIDLTTILDVSSIEQHRERDTKSTTTASEQPDLEEDSRDSLRLSNNIPQVTENISGGGTYAHIPLLPVDLTHCHESEKITFHQVERETFQDPNQPLNLSTNTVDCRTTHILSSPPNHTSPLRTNGEWALRRTIQYSPNNYSNEKTSFTKISTIGNKSGSYNNVGGKVSNTSVSLNLLRSPPVTLSTNPPHISTVTVPDRHLSSVSVNATAGSPVTHISQLVKSGTTVSHLPSLAKVVTTLPHVSAVTPVGATISNIPSATIGQIQAVSADSSLPIGASIAHISNLTPVARMTTSSSVTSNANATMTVASADNRTIPIMAGSGIQLPTHLVTNGVHLTGTTGGILGQPAIQVITPEGYKLLPAEHAPNGTKSVAFTLAQSGGLEHLSAVDDGKHGPVMVAVNKNGLSALHLAVPATARAVANHTTGHSVPVTSVPLNLSVPGSGPLKASQAGSTPILPPYIPLTHTNGLTRLVQGVSVVGPLVVSQAQRVVVPKNIHHKSPNNPTTTTLPLAQYATALTGGLVNSVVVVSAPATATAPVATTTMGLSTAKNL